MSANDILILHTLQCITCGNQIRDGDLRRAEQRARRRQPLPDVVGGETEDGGGGGRRRHGAAEDVDAVATPSFGLCFIKYFDGFFDTFAFN